MDAHAEDGSSRKSTGGSWEEWGVLDPEKLWTREAVAPRFSTGAMRFVGGDLQRRGVKRWLNAAAAVSARCRCALFPRCAIVVLPYEHPTAVTAEDPVGTADGRRVGDGEAANKW